MEGFTRDKGVCPKLLDFIANEKEWPVKREKEEAGNMIQKTHRRHGFSEENKLELRLAPPGENNWSMTKSHNSRERDEPDLLSLGIQKVQKFSQENNRNNNNNISSSSPWSCSAKFLQFSSSSSPSSGVGLTAPQRFPVTGKESSQLCSTTAVDILNSEKKAFSPSPATTTSTAVPNTSQRRSAPGPAPVVGWPPIKSFRKNVASTSYSKSSSSELQKIKPAEVTSDKKPVVNFTSEKGLFVKINMDGIPIGRKVDLKAYDTYEKLASVVDELFRGLLEAQIDPSAEGIHGKPEQKAITGLLDGSGEYTLVYEDNEGDRMLVGDVPWHMFVTTVKRLRVLKSSELPAFTLGSEQGKMQA